MTKLDSYINAYNAAIAEHLEHEYVAPRSLWIACKWSEDVGFVPWRADAESILKNLCDTDPELFKEVASGLQFLNDAVDSFKT